MNETEIRSRRKAKYDLGYFYNVRLKHTPPKLTQIYHQSISSMLTLSWLGWQTSTTRYIHGFSSYLKFSELSTFPSALSHEKPWCVNVVDKVGRGYTAGRTFLSKERRLKRILGRYFAIQGDNIEQTTIIPRSLWSFRKKDSGS